MIEEYNLFWLRNIGLNNLSSRSTDNKWSNNRRFYLNLKGMWYSQTFYRKSHMGRMPAGWLQVVELFQCHYFYSVVTNARPNNLRACLHAKINSSYCYNNWKYDRTCFAIVIGWRKLTAVLEIDAGGLCGVGSLWNQVVHYETKWHSGFMTKFPPKVGFSCIFIIFGNLINDCTISSILRYLSYNKWN